MAARRARPVGGHAPTRGGLATGALGYLDRVGAEAVQVFVSNPRGWALSEGDREQDEAFRAGCAERGVPAFVHVTYLVNFGSPNAETLARSVATTRHALRRAGQLGMRGVVLHAGSAVSGQRRDVALRQVREHLLPLLDGAGPRLLIEPTAGGGQALAARLDDLPDYLDTLDNHPRVGICLDTCHLHAAGHDLGTVAGMRSTLTVFDRLVGRSRLGLVHANDSRDPAGSTRDRHAALGSGTIGTEPFGVLFTHPVVAGVPIVVETAEADHPADIATLRKLRATAATTRRPASAKRSSGAVRSNQ